MNFAYRHVVIGLAVTLLAGCTSSPAMEDTANQPTFDGLVKVSAKRMDEVWVRPGFDPSAYSKIMFRGAGIEYRPVKPASRIRSGSQSQFPISESDRARLAEIVTEEFRQELTQIESYDVTDAPGADTLLLTIGLTDVVSNVPPDQMGRHEIYLSEVGMATLVIEFRDSESGAVMVRGADRRAAERYGQEFHRSSSVTNWPIVKRLAATWARGLRRGIDDMQDSAK